jgi:nucleoside 2-deoxyribosyltransferase
MLKIYLAHPISGLSFDEVVAYYMVTKQSLSLHYDVFYPMIGKGYLRTEKTLKAGGYQKPLSTNHAILGRDRWMVQTCDIVYVDFTGSEVASIGCVMELAFAKAYGKHVIAVIPETNVHNHAFVLECADVVFPTHEEAIEYLKTLSERRI